MKMQAKKASKWIFFLALTLGILTLSFTPTIAMILFSDDFEDGNYGGWSKNGGSWSVITDGSHVFKQSSTSATACAYAGETTWTDYTVQGKIKLLGFNGSGGLAGICVRFQNTGNFYYAALKSDNQLEIGKKVGGTAVTLSSKTYSVNTGSWYTIELKISGSQLQCSINGILELTTADMTFTSGKIGLYALNTAVEFDDLYAADEAIEPPQTPTPSPTLTPTPTPTPTFSDEAYYIAPFGNDSNPGTFALPFYSLTKAVSQANPGSTIFVRGGTYNYTATVTIANSGTASAGIRIWAYPGEIPIFDFSGNPSDRRGVMINGSYWHLKGLIIQNSPQHGLTISGGSHNTIENCTARYNHNMGMNLIAEAAYNSFINCDAHHNFDEQNGGENADGFGAKYGLGPGNLFQACRAWSNSDDGWDLWEAGIGVRLEECWAYNNGLNFMNLSDFKGDGNGFKLGKGTGTVAHVLINCLAWNNLLGNGYEDNGYTGGVHYLNCTGYQNAKKNFEASGTGPHIVKNCLSFMGGAAENIGSQVDAAHNSWQGFTVTAADFASLDDTVASGVRNGDGSLPVSDFLRLTSGSNLINAGIDVGLSYLGNAPDLGAFEKE